MAHTQHPLDRFMQEVGLSRSELARRANIPRVHVYRITDRRYQPKIDTVDALVRAANAFAQEKGSALRIVHGEFATPRRKPRKRSRAA